MSTILDEQGVSDALDLILADIKREVLRAKRLHPGDFHNPHEGYAVLLEEVDELWDEVKRKGGGRDAVAAKEATQVGAMAVRYLLEVINA